MLEAWLIYKRFAPFIGLALIPVLIMLAVSKGETRHWKKQSAGFEQLYRGEVTAHQQTIGNYRAAAVQARAADKANAERVGAEQRAISERTTNDYEARIAVARAAAERVRRGTPATHPGGGGAAPVSGLPAAAGRPGQAAVQDGLPADDRLTATEQAIQLDELIKWVTRQHAVDPNK